MNVPFFFFLPFFIFTEQLHTQTHWNSVPVLTDISCSRYFPPVFISSTWERKKLFAWHEHECANKYAMPLGGDKWYIRYQKEHSEHVLWVCFALAAPHRLAGVQRKVRKHTVESENTMWRLCEVRRPGWTDLSHLKNKATLTHHRVSPVFCFSCLSHCYHTFQKSLLLCLDEIHIQFNKFGLVARKLKPGRNTQTSFLKITAYA